jgi:hypothetical protein
LEPRVDFKSEKAEVVKNSSEIVNGYPQYLDLENSNIFESVLAITLPGQNTSS